MLLEGFGGVELRVLCLSPGQLLSPLVPAEAAEQKQGRGLRISGSSGGLETVDDINPALPITRNIP